MLPLGTINIFLFINQDLTDAAMSRALMLCGESKAAAVSQLLLRREFYIEYREIFNDFKISFEMPSLLEQKFLGHNRTSNLILCVSLYLHLMDQVRWELIMEPEAIREGKHLLIYGLYWKNGDFFDIVYCYLGCTLEADPNVPRYFIRLL